MTGMVEALARTGFQIVYPGEVVLDDEVIIEPEAINDEIRGHVVDGLCQLPEVGSEILRNLQPTGIVVTTIKQNASLAFFLPFGETPHHGSPAVDIGPATGVGDRDVILGADLGEEALEVDLLHQHLDEELLVFPEAERCVIVVGCCAGT